MGKKYLIYVDILGYKGKAEEIAEKTGIEESVCRETFLRNPLKKKIDETKTTRFQGISEIESSDNFILIVNTVEEVIEILGEISRIRIPHKAFQWIPLEIGVGTKKINEDIEVELFSRTEVIAFLKEDIINPYRHHFKQEYNKNVRRTFVLFTENFYDDLEPLDKHYCTSICHEGKSFYLGNLEKIHERCKMYAFLRKIGYPRSRLYGRIDDVYVPPAEFRDIQKSLKEKKIVFITGTQEYGKTYTAVRLLWEYFCDGYEVEWVKGRGERERDEVRKWMEDIKAKVRPHRIVYFEDPFGKTRYEKRDYLEKEMGTIIESVTNLEDSYVIITSREEVFKEFEKDKLSAVNIKEFEEKLNLMRPSYDYEKRKEIVRRWAEEENCAWVTNPRLKNTVFDVIEDERNLTTPLKMRGFAVATVRVNEEHLLVRKIKEKSEETARAFAEEMKNMTWDKIVFLSLLFVSRYDTYFMRGIYEEIIEELRLVDALNFNEILHWFEDDKVRVGYDLFLDDEFVEFSHPAYSEALKYLISGKGSFRQKYKKVFERNLLFKLAKKDETAWDVTWFVARNFDKLSDDVGNLLLALAEKKRTAGNIAGILKVNFDKLPDDVRNRLLSELSEKDEAAEDVAEVVARNFDKLPGNVRNRLLLELSEKKRTAGNIAGILKVNFDKLPRNVRNRLLLELSEKDETAWAVAEVVARNFDKLPDDVRNLLFKLAKKDETAWAVVEVVARNFDKLPDDVRNRLLLELSEKEEAARYVAEVVARNFDKLPDDVRNLLFTLAKKDETAWAVAEVVARNFDKLPDDVRNRLLLELSEKDEAAWTVARILTENFDRLPEDVMSLLFTLAENDRTAGDVVYAVAENFDRLPNNVGNRLLLELSEKEEAARYVAEAVARNFDKLPEDVRNLLFKLAKKDETAKDIAEAVARNSDGYLEDVMSLLFTVAENDRIAGDVAEAVEKYFDKLPGNVRNRLLFTLAEKDETAEDVAKAVAEHFNKLSRHVRNRLLFTLAEKDETARYVAKAVAEHFNKLPEKLRNELMLTLAEKDWAAGYVARAAVENFDEYLEDVRGLLFALAVEDVAAWAATKVLAMYSDHLPRDVKNRLLFTLAEKDVAAWAVAEAVVMYSDHLPRDVS